jgi:hypothetical protein
MDLKNIVNRGKIEYTFISWGVLPLEYVQNASSI